MMAGWDRQRSRCGSLPVKSRRCSGEDRREGCGGFRTIGGGGGSSFGDKTFCCGTIFPCTWLRNLVAASSRLTIIRVRFAACPTGTGSGTGAAESGRSRRPTASWSGLATRRKDSCRRCKTNGPKLDDLSSAFLLSSETDLFLCQSAGYCIYNNIQTLTGAANSAKCL
jgi:hypothetical protein